MEEKPNIIECWESPDFYRPAFEPLEDWRPWFTPVKLMNYVPLEGDEKKLFHKCTKRQYVKNLGFDEGWFICARRTGKSRVASLLAIHSALFGDWKRFLAPGEYAYIYIIAVDRRQARGVLEYCRGLLSYFGDMIEKELSWEIILKTRVIISIQTASFKTSRGRSVAMLIMDEAAFFQDEFSSNPASEILTAVLPSLLPGGKVIGLSSPFGKFGLVYTLYKENFGRNNSDVLIWQADAKTMRPNYSDKRLERMRKRDPVAFKSEYQAQFRDDLETYLSELDLEAVEAKGRLMIPFVRGRRYYCFVDPSGGKNDSFTFAVGHVENNKAVIDRQEEYKSPFNPSEIVSKISEILKSYEIYQVTGDRFSGNWCSGSFKENGILYNVSELSKDEIFLRFQAYCKSKEVELLDSERAKIQATSIQRKAVSGGREVFVHGLAGDELINSVAGCCCGLLEKYTYRQSLDEILSQRKPIISSRKESPLLQRMREKRMKEFNMRREILGELKKEEEERGTTSASIAKRE